MGVDGFDQHVDDWFENLRGNAWADRLFYTASEAADFSLLWHLAGAALGVAGREREAIRLAAALGFESLLVNGAIKSAMPRERPVVQRERPHHLRIPLTTSFPSGHASSAFMAAGLLADGSPKLAPLLYTVATVVAASRVHVQIHHASDVVGGALVGVGLAALVRRVWPLHARASARR